jgi:hypothetical protein
MAQETSEDAMRTLLVSLILTVATAMALAGCSPVQEPWDSTGHFKNDRAVPAELNKALRERAEHGQTDRHMGIQQMNRT